MSRALRKTDLLYLRQALQNKFNTPHVPPDIPDRVSLSFLEYHQLISEYNSMTSAFDPATLLDATIDQPMTRRLPLPPGDYIATVGDIKAESWTKKDDPSKSGVKFSVTLKVQVTDPVAQAAQGGAETTKFDTIFIDTTPTGGIDFAPGKNSQLRRYREALKMNEAGQPFVPRQMIGRSLRVKISHSTYQGEIQDNVDSVASV